MAQFRLWSALPAARVGSKEKESAPGAPDAASNNSLAVPRCLDDAEVGIDIQDEDNLRSGIH